MLIRGSSCAPQLFVRLKKEQESGGGAQAGVQTFTSIKELARRFALTFGDPAKFRECVVTMHRWAQVLPIWCQYICRFLFLSVFVFVLFNSGRESSLCSESSTRPQRPRRHRSSRTWPSSASSPANCSNRTRRRCKCCTSKRGSGDLINVASSDACLSVQVRVPAETHGRAVHQPPGRVLAAARLLPGLPAACSWRGGRCVPCQLGQEALPAQSLALLQTETRRYRPTQNRVTSCCLRATSRVHLFVFQELSLPARSAPSTPKLAKVTDLKSVQGEADKDFSHSDSYLNKSKILLISLILTMVNSSVIRRKQQTWIHFLFHWNLLHGVWTQRASSSAPATRRRTNLWRSSFEFEEVEEHRRVSSVFRRPDQPASKVPKRLLHCAF